MIGMRAMDLRSCSSSWPRCRMAVLVLFLIYFFLPNGRPAAAIA